MNLDELYQTWERTREKKRRFAKKVCVCAGAGCVSSGALEILEEFKKVLKENALDSETEIVPSGCMGACNQGPLVAIYPDGTIYQKMTVEKVKDVVKKHFIEKKTAKSHLLFSECSGRTPVKAVEHEFYKRQEKIVLKNCGEINPESIEDYIIAGGYQAMHKVLVFFSPQRE